MVTVIFFTKNDAAALARSLSPLVHDAIEGHVAEVVVIDSGSQDGTSEIAEGAGCKMIEADRGAPKRAIREARGDWIVVLEPGARLVQGWYDAVMEHLMTPDAAAARFSRKVEGNWLSRLFSPSVAKARPLSLGLLVSRSQALANLDADARSGEDLIRGLRLRPLDALIEPRPDRLTTA